MDPWSWFLYRMKAPMTREKYRGGLAMFLILLASNLANNIDDAFVRRCNFCIEFPFPDEKSRLQIWKDIFPNAAPTDKGVDFNFLRFSIPRGVIDTYSQP
jgi:SpoVK/Ycf46/Vps4 family AAA+-type ATPase